MFLFLFSICMVRIIGIVFFSHNFSGMKRTCWTTGSWRCCLSLEVQSSIPAAYTIIYRFRCGFIYVSQCQSIKIKSTTNMYIDRTRVQFKINAQWHGRWNWHLCIPDELSVDQFSLGHIIRIVFLKQFRWHKTNVLGNWQLTVFAGIRRTCWATGSWRCFSQSRLRETPSAASCPARSSYASEIVSKTI